MSDLSAIQMDFVVAQKEADRGNVDWPLLIVVRHLDQGKLLQPIFQREFIWPDRKVRGWINSVISGQAIGVIVTYQLKGGGPKYICDGWQRLTATSRFVKNPQGYGFVFGPNEAEDYCEAYGITVQHRIYKDHQEAMQAFHNLNKGTALTPAEYYKGYLCLDSDVGQRAYSEVPSRVRSHTRPLSTIRSPGRRNGSTLLRDSFALFLQYVTSYSGMTFWDNGKQVVGASSPIEKKLRGTIENWTMEQLDSKMASFEQFIASQIVEIREAAKDTGQEGKRFSRTMLRWLLHLAVWRKNNSRPTSLHKQFLRAFLAQYKDYANFTSRLIAIDDDGLKTPISFQVGKLEAVTRFCRMFNIDLVDGRKRIRRSAAAPGYDISHIRPVSEYGEGETFIEPAMSNRARGARTVETTRCPPS